MHTMDFGDFIDLDADRTCPATPAYTAPDYAAGFAPSYQQQQQQQQHHHHHHQQHQQQGQGQGQQQYGDAQDMDAMGIYESSDPFAALPYNQLGYPDMSFSGFEQDLSYFTQSPLDGADSTTVAPLAPPLNRMTSDAQSSTITTTTTSSMSAADRKSKSSSASSHPPPDPSDSDSEPEPEPEPTKRKGRKGKGGGGSSADEGGKRSRFLEKNRIAASKCRQKKKGFVSELEIAKNGLEARNAQLQMEYHSLVNVVVNIKNQLMSHAHCDDANIDKWLETEARRVVQGKGARVRSPQPSAGSFIRRRQLSTPSSFAQPGGDGAAEFSSRGNSLTFSHTPSQASPNSSVGTAKMSVDIKQEDDAGDDMLSGEED